MGVVFKAFGYFIPDKRVTNEELSTRFNISQEWILERTGILERRYFEDGATSDMIVLAAQDCLKQAEINPEEIDCIIIATMTPDFHCPSTASIVHKKLKTSNASGFDVMAACSGFIFALELAQSLIETRKYKNVLVAGADKMSSCIEQSDRKTSLVLADGAGVCLLQYSKVENQVIDTICKIDSDSALDVIIPNGGSQKPLTEEISKERNHYLRFQSKNVFENGIQLFIRAINYILKRNNLSIEDIDLIVPHQANKRMIEELSRRLGVPISKFVINVEMIGNTSAATVPIAISQTNEREKLNGKILSVTVGAGFTYAATILNF